MAVGATIYKAGKTVVGFVGQVTGLMIEYNIHCNVETSVAKNSVYMAATWIIFLF